MKLLFDTIKVTNFKSVKKSLILDLAGGGLHFVRGRNEVDSQLGANDCGKSTLFVDAPSWCLFGRTISNLRNPDIKPWKSDGATSVSLTLKADNRLRTITRSTSPNKLLLDGKETSQDNIEKILGLGFDVFSHTILLGQSRPLFFDLTAKDKLQLFSDTLTLERWEQRSLTAGAEASELTRQLAVTEGEVTGAEAALAQTESLLKTAKERTAEWEAERKNRVKGQQEKVDTLAKQLTTLQRTRDGADLAYDGAMTELKSLEKEIASLTHLGFVTQGNYQIAFLKIDTYKTQRDQLTKELAAFGKADKCPICEQPIKGTNLAKHKKELANKIADLDKAIADGIPVKTRNAKEAAAGKLEDARKYEAIFKGKAQRARDELDRATAPVAELQAKINSLQDSQKEWQAESNPHHEQTQTLRRQLQQTVTKLEALDKTILNLTRRIERTKFWIKGFKDVRLYIIEEILQELELTTNAMLPDIGLPDWQVDYAVEKETKSGTTQRGLNVSIFSPHHKEAVRWESWGGGVGQRLRIVSALALSEVLLNHAGVQANWEVLDEPTRHLSKEGVQDLCEFLARRAQQLEKTIFFIDHKAVESVHFSDVITVVKTKAGSTIAES